MNKSIAGAVIRIGGKSGLHGTAHRPITGQSNLTIRATVTKQTISLSETGNLCVQQLQIGPLWFVPNRGRVEGLMLCGNTLHRLIMLATHLFGAERAGTALDLGGTESGLSFSYHGNSSPSGDVFYLVVNVSEKRLQKYNRFY